MRHTDPATDRFGFLRLPPDAHTLGATNAARAVEACGFRVHQADDEVRSAAKEPLAAENGRRILSWIRGKGITMLALSWRLDPELGSELFDRFYYFLDATDLLARYGGPIRGVFFAGLPSTCDLIRERHPDISGLFSGEEDSGELLDILGIARVLYPTEMLQSVVYDEARLAFGKDLVRRGDFGRIGKIDRSASRQFGRRGDSLASRLVHGEEHGLPPLVRAHAGPWLPDRKEALKLFIGWARSLGAGGMLDVLSIGSSQLSQSRFGEDWGESPNGGGVPVNSAEEYAAIWNAARPMLVRSYSGAGSAARLVPVYEASLDIAWHALSFWWFSTLDARGPLGVRENLDDHFAALRAIAATGKPFEANVPHHFAFRGTDDASYVATGYLAACAAKKAGIRLYILQVMLQTPRWTWGVQDLAKARALLAMTRDLQDGTFKVVLQPRAGLDYLSRDTTRAKIQLAAATALMDDIEPGNSGSPSIIHVVSHSEATGLADPPVIDESIRITRMALDKWRESRANGSAPDMGLDAEARERTRILLADARALVAGIESAIPDLYTPEGFYLALAAGFFPLPWLAEQRDIYPHAAAGLTAFSDGGMTSIDEDGKPLAMKERLVRASEALRLITGAKGGVN